MQEAADILLRFVVWAMIAIFTCIEFLIVGVFTALFPGDEKS